MDNWIVNIGMLMMMVGVAVMFDIFSRIGPIDTRKGMRRLGWVLVAAGFLVALSQSERTRSETRSSTAQQT